MEARQLDDLARVLADGTSRRRAIGTLLAFAATIVAATRGAKAQSGGALGERCNAHAECDPVDPGAGWATCRGNVCCLVRGSRCQHDGECCDGEPCLPPGYCGGAGASGLAPGAWCPPGQELCSTHPSYGPVPAICADNGIWEDGPTNCCFPQDGRCHNDAECCAGLVCSDNACEPAQATQTDAWSEAWRLATDGGSWASPVAGNGLVYLIGQQALLAVSTADGRIVWTHESDQGGGPSGAALAGDAVVVTNRNGVLAALGAGDGSPRWQVGDLGQLLGRPLVVDKTVYVNAGRLRGTLFALDAVTGVVAWSADIGTGTFHDPWAVAGTIFVTGSDPETSAAVILAIDAETGQELWRTAPEARLHVRGAGSDQIYATSQADGALIALSPDGDERWRFDPGSPLVWGVDPPREVNGVVYAATGVGQGGPAPDDPAEPGVIALDAQSGARIWSTALLPHGAGGGPVIVGNNLAVTSGPIPAVVLDLATGAVRWQLPESDQFAVGIGAADGLVLAVFSDEVVAYRPPA